MTVDARSSDVSVPADGVDLRGTLVIPEGATGIVLFAHGSGSGRKSPRNGQVAAVLQARGLATLLIDLLTEAEERSDAASAHLRFDIAFLAARVARATAWLRAHPSTALLRIGYFGASTGAAAALQAAAERPADVAAVVSRGGRPDLAMPYLAKVKAPTLLIVGGADVPVLPLNQSAYEALKCERDLAIVPDATHLFEEPGALDTVSRLAAGWFVKHLTPAAGA